MLQENTPAELLAFQNLEGVLEDEIKVYRTLLDLVRREKEVLISAQLDELNESNRTKEALIMKLRALDRNREKLAKEMAVLLGANAESPRLLELAAKMVDPQSSKLRAIHSTLDLLIKRIRDLNENNESLVQSSLRVVNGALGAIKQTLQPTKTYGVSGEAKQTGEVAGHFVSREV